MSPAVALRLGRVSNLPTIWTNTLAGVALAGVSPWHWATATAVLGLSSAYLGGMFLNDAFDRAIDARDRPSRPIPSGLVDANTVFALGFALLLASVAALSASASAFGVASTPVVLSGLALSGMIIGYNWSHKGNPLSPVTMGLCRLLTYVAAGLAATALLSGALLYAAIMSLCYLIGLTYVAKQESFGSVRNLWPLLFLAAPIVYGVLHANGPVAWIAVGAIACWILFSLSLLRGRRPVAIPRVVVSLIAGIALLDAMFLALSGRTTAAPVAGLCFVATLVSQRWISGT